MLKDYTRPLQVCCSMQQLCNFNIMNIKIMGKAADLTVAQQNVTVNVDFKKRLKLRKVAVHHGTIFRYINGKSGEEKSCTRNRINSLT